MAGLRIDYAPRDLSRPEALKKVSASGVIRFQGQTEPEEPLYKTDNKPTCWQACRQAITRFVTSAWTWMVMMIRTLPYVFSQNAKEPSLESPRFGNRFFNKEKAIDCYHKIAKKLGKDPADFSKKSVAETAAEVQRLVEFPFSEASGLDSAKRGGIQAALELDPEKHREVLASLVQTLPEEQHQRLLINYCFFLPSHSSNFNIVYSPELYTAVENVVLKRKASGAEYWKALGLRAFDGDAEKARDYQLAKLKSAIADHHDFTRLAPAVLEIDEQASLYPYIRSLYKGKSVESLYALKPLIALHNRQPGVRPIQELDTPITISPDNLKTVLENLDLPEIVQAKTSAFHSEFVPYRSENTLDGPLTNAFTKEVLKNAAYKLQGASTVDAEKMAQALLKYFDGFQGVHTIDFSKPITDPEQQALYQKLFVKPEEGGLLTPTANHLFILKDVEKAVERKDYQTILKWLKAIKPALDHAKTPYFYAVRDGGEGFAPFINSVFLMPYENPDFGKDYAKLLRPDADTPNQSQAKGAAQLLGGILSRAT